ncbi:MAG: DUF4043 family protein, partial [Gammaproteobacteria bacterium]|nr:DUF4043 family protein [Gammaproteobacteria bacterium]
MPIVSVTDLQSSKGDTVNLDISGVLSGYPIMGDEPLAGHGMNMDFGAMKLSVNQYRGMVNTGGLMSRQRTKWMLNPLARAKLAGWNARTMDQLITVHMLGARGTQGGRLWNIPFEDHPNFGKIVTNKVRAPTKSRYFIPNGKTNPVNIATTDYLTLEFFDLLRTMLDSMEFPIEPIEIPDDEMAEDEPLYLGFVTPWQWHYIEQKTKGRNWRDMLQNALQRRRGTSQHPLFRSATGYYAGFLLKKYRYAIRFKTDDNIQRMAGDDLTETTVQAPRAIDRLAIVGGQALGEAYAAHSSTGRPAFWNEEDVDHKNSKEISTGMV